MPESIIVHHLGLGDHIICNGLVRELLKLDNSLFLHYPVKKHNFNNVKAMLSDLENKIKLVAIQNDEEMLKYASLFSSSKQIKLGVFNSSWHSLESNWCERFYEQANIDYSKRWDYSFDISLQNNVLPEVSDEFVFIHDDIKRNYSIDSGKLTKNNYIHYRPGGVEQTLGQTYEHTIFDYIPIIMNAKEIHCINSCFSIMIDQIKELKSKPKFIHEYVRKFSPIYKNNWTILK